MTGTRGEESDQPGFLTVGHCQGRLYLGLLQADAREELILEPAGASHLGRKDEGRLRYAFLGQALRLFSERQRHLLHLFLQVNRLPPRHKA